MADMNYTPDPNVKFLIYKGDSRYLEKGNEYEVRYFDDENYAVFMNDGNEIVEPKNNFVSQSEYIEDVGQHYKQSVEPIDLIEAFDLNFNRGNVIKYTARAGRKDDELQDLRKALWYLEREIKNLEDGR